MFRMQFIAAAVALIFSVASFPLFAADPMLTDYSYSSCEGSLTPYPQIDSPVEYPDSLVPVFINHVGRHGARYPASASNCLALKRALERADSLGTITSVGRKLAAINRQVMALSADRWGALDSLGEAEQRGIASRMYFKYTPVFSDASSSEVRAISSYSPRAMMSMFAFLHQIDRLNNRLTFNTSTGRVNSPLMRPFDIDEDYIEFRRTKQYAEVYDNYFASVCPVTAIRRALGDGYPFESPEAERDLAITEYYVLAGLSAMSVDCELSVFFTKAEMNALWSCFNLRQYLQRTATTVSAVPAEIASDLVLDIISTTDAFVDGTDRSACAVFRFGHAETLMPLLSLLRLPGCFYMTNYFDTVASHWRDFDVVPMAANIQFVIFKAKASGHYYVRVELNERPLRLRGESDPTTIFPWGELRRFMMNCVPLYAQ